jgi:hypothetical protein
VRYLALLRTRCGCRRLMRLDTDLRRSILIRMKPRYRFIVNFDLERPDIPAPSLETREFFAVRRRRRGKDLIIVEFEEE